MLTIRNEQMALLAEIETGKFEDRMLIHIGKFFPKMCKIAEENHLREFIRHGIKRAAAYGISAQRDVCRYIDLMVVFGRDFDTDKRFPWAAEILMKGKPSAKTEILFTVAKRHLKNA